MLKGKALVVGAERESGEELSPRDMDIWTPRGQKAQFELKTANADLLERVDGGLIIRIKKNYMSKKVWVLDSPEK